MKITRIKGNYLDGGIGNRNNQQQICPTISNVHKITKLFDSLVEHEG